MKILDVELVKDKSGKMGWCYVVHTETRNNKLRTYVILKPVFDRKKPKGWKRDLTKKENWVDLFNFSASAWYNSKREYMTGMASYIFEDGWCGSSIITVDEPEIFKLLNNKGILAC